MRAVVSFGLVLFLVMLGLVFFLSPTKLLDSLRQSNLDAIRSNAKQQRRDNQNNVIEWRSLEIKPRIAFSDAGTTGNILGGDFNGDGLEEILFLPQQGLGIIYTPGGDTIPTALNGAMFQPAGAWDYDLDGKLELFPIPTLATDYSAAFDSGRTFQTEIRSLDGVIVATLDGLAIRNPELVFDYDGDSNADLALLTGPTEFAIYAPGGIVLTRFHTDGNGARGNWLPIIKSLPAPIDQPGGGYNSADIGGAVNIADVNGDGKLEVVSLNGILDLSSGRITRLKFTSITKPDHTSNLPPAIGDFFSTGFDVVAVPTMLTDKQTVCVSIFDRTGSLAGVSEVGYSLLGLLTIHSGGQDYLVAHAPDRILIIP